MVKIIGIYINWMLYSKGNEYSQYIKVFERPIVSNVKQAAIPKVTTI